MKRPTFIHGAGMALALSFCGAALFAAIAPFFAPGQILRLLITLLAGAYVLYLLGRSGERTGRVTATVLWAVAAGATWFIAPPLPLFLIVHVGLISSLTNPVRLAMTRSKYSGCRPSTPPAGLLPASKA